MLDTVRRRIKILLGIVIFLLPLIIVSRILIVVNYIDPQTLFYERGAILPDLFHGVIYLLTLTVLVSGVFLRLRFPSVRPLRLRRRVEKFSSLSPVDEDELLLATVVRRPTVFSRWLERPADGLEPGVGTRLVYENTAASTVFAATLSGFLFVASAVLMGAGMLMENRFGVLDFFTLLAAVFSGVFFVLAGMKRVYPYSPVFGVLSMVPVLWCILRLVGDFWDLSQNSNEYSHVLQIVCLLLMITFFFQEGRFALPFGRSYRFGLYVSSALSCLLIIATVSVPNLLLASFWMVDFNAEVFYSLVEFTVGIYIIAKLFSLLRKMDSLSEHDVIVPEKK